MVIAGAALAALAFVGFWIASRQPTYGAPPGDQIDILLELAGVFPDKYGILWRQHGMLRSTDPEAHRDPLLLGRAQFMHNLTTGAERTDGDVYVEVGYRFYALDHQLDSHADMYGGYAQSLGEITADEGSFACWCDANDPGGNPGHSGTNCSGFLGSGNYEFWLSVSYNRDQCAAAPPAARREEFMRTMRTADRLIDLYLEPLRRKPRWL